MIHIWDQKLVAYFQTNLALDREAEELRKDLILRVSQQKLFEVIDKDSNGFLTINEFAFALKKQNKPFNLECLRRMVKQYDKYGEFSLNYRDFGGFLLPRGENRDANKKTEIDVNNTNFNLFIDLVYKELEIVQTLSDMAEDIKKTKEFITWEGFRSIAGTGKYITEINLKDYLINKGVEIRDSNEIAKIIYRYDRNFDGYFGYDEFKDIFSNSNDNIIITGTLIPENEKYLKKLDLNFLKNKLSIQSNDDTKDDSNFMSRPSKKQGLMYDYSFDQEMPNENHIENKLNPQISPSSYLNPFKRNLSNVFSMTNNQNVSISPLERKFNSSIYDIVGSNSILNNSLINMSLSPNRSAFISQRIPEKEEKEINNTSPQFSPYKEFNKQKTNNSPYLRIEKPINKNRLYFLDYLNEVVVKELICENAREEISKSADVNMPDLFSFFDYSHRIKISIADLQESLRKISIIVSLDELYLLFKKYDNDNDGYLNYREFCQIILPKNSIHAKNLSKHVPPVCFTELSSNALNLISNFFYSVFSCVKACENKRREIASYQDFSNVECFEMVKSRLTNTIFKEDENELLLTSFELDILMDYFDKDKNGQITFNEFLKELAPRGIVV